jgi:hypothetical protein
MRATRIHVPNHEAQQLCLPPGTHRPRECRAFGSTAPLVGVGSNGALWGSSSVAGARRSTTRKACRRSKAQLLVRSRRRLRMGLLSTTSGARSSAADRRSSDDEHDSGHENRDRVVAGEGEIVTRLRLGEPVSRRRRRGAGLRDLVQRRWLGLRLTGGSLRVRARSDDSRRRGWWTTRRCRRAAGVPGVAGWAGACKAADRQAGSCGHEHQSEREADRHGKPRARAWAATRGLGGRDTTVEPFDLVARQSGALSSQQLGNREQP